MNLRTPSRVWLGLAVASTMVLAGVSAVPEPESDHPHKQPPGGYYTVELRSGRIACAAGAGAAATDNVCPDPTDASVIESVIPEGADVTILEMRWAATSALGGKTLALTAPVAYQSTETARAEGPSILRSWIKSLDDFGAPAGASIHVVAGASHDLGVVFDQPFELAISSFVDLPVPDGYTAFPKEEPSGSEPEKTAHDHAAKADGYYTVSQAHGKIGCAAGAVAVATDDLCPNSAADLKFLVPAGADQSLVEMVWQPVSALGGKSLAMSTPATYESSAIKRTEGLSPVRVVVASENPGGAAEDLPLYVTAGASHDAGVVFEQEFEVYVSTFVDMAIPPDYTAIA